MLLREVSLKDGCYLGICQKFDTSEHPIEVAISLFWMAYIHFKFLLRMEGEIPLLTKASFQIEFAGF